MNPMCAKCKKIVYPTEKLNCLDKVKTGALSFFFQPAAHSATALKKKLQVIGHDWVHIWVEVVIYVITGMKCFI